MISSVTAWIFNRMADAINFYTSATAPKAPICSCVKKTHLNWTEILVIDPHCRAHTGGRQVTK